MKKIALVFIWIALGAVGLFLMVAFWPLPDGFWWIVSGFLVLWIFKQIEQDREAARTLRHNEILDRLTTLNARQRDMERRMGQLLEGLTDEVEQLSYEVRRMMTGGGP